MDPCHVIKLDFHEKNSVKRPFNHLRNRAQLSHCSSCILDKFSFNLKKLNSGKFRNKSYEHFTISLPVRIFVNHEKNYHFVIVSLSNHESTLVSIKWTFWAYLEFTSLTYMVIITIFLFHGLNTIIEHLRYTKLRFSSVYELWIVIKLLNKTLKLFSLVISIIFTLYD